MTGSTSVMTVEAPLLQTSAAPNLPRLLAGIPARGAMTVSVKRTATQGVVENTVLEGKRYYPCTCEVHVRGPVLCRVNDALTEHSHGDPEHRPRR